MFEFLEDNFLLEWWDQEFKAWCAAGGWAGHDELRCLLACWLRAVAMLWRCWFALLEWWDQELRAWCAPRGWA